MPSLPFRLAIGPALIIAGIAVSGCSVQRSDSPTWSLNGPPAAPVTATTANTKYGDWNGPGAPQPLTYDEAR